LGANGVGGVEGVMTLYDGNTPGTTATLSYTKWADLEAVNGLIKCNGSGDYSAATEGTDYLASTRIDDTKGNGDTGYVWSADKSFDQFALKGTIAGQVWSGTHDFGGAVLEIPNGTSGTTDATGEAYLDTNGDGGTNFSGEVIQVYTGAANKYLFPMALPLAASQDNYVPTYDASTKTVSWETGSGGGATTALDNLASVAINTSLISDTDNTDDLGSSSKAWKDAYIKGAIGVSGASITNGVTATTQSAGDNSTKVATTAYADVNKAPIGVWTTPTYSAGNFTANGSMTVSVSSGQVGNYSYYINGKMMTILIALEGFTIGGTPNNEIYIAIPASATAKKITANMCAIYNGAWATGRFDVADSASVIRVTKQDESNWSTGATNYIRGQITFEIN
jgi:hypothetical protein